MKVVLAHKCFYKKGGAEVFFFEVGRVLKEHGHEVAYFSCNDDQNIESEWSKYFIDAPDFKAPNPIKKIGALFSIPYNLEAKKKFGKLLDDFKPDIVHCFNIMTHISPSIMVAARERNIPVVISHNDYKHICPNYQLYRNGETCEACKGHHYMNCVKYKCAHSSLAFSAASAIELYVHHWMKVYEKNVTLHLFSCDYIAQKTEEFWGRKIQQGKLTNPFKIPARPDSVEESDYGLFFGRLIGEKGVDVLLKALALVKDIPFVIIGNGPDEDYLKQMSQELGLNNVHFVGPKWGAELEDYLNKAKFVVVPSLWQETFPYVILQAFAACKPVIGTKRGGIPEMIGDDRGLLYEATDEKELSELIKKMYESEMMRKEMGAAGRKYIEDNFTDDCFYSVLKANYDRALSL